MFGKESCHLPEGKARVHTQFLATPKSS
jgi:hypothetical protein